MSRQHIDIIVLVLYLALVLSLGIWSARRGFGRTTSGYFLGGRNFTWPFIGLSLFATDMSSMQFVGQAGFAYQAGIAAANPHLLGAFMLGFSAAFFAPVFVRSRIRTIPELLELRYGKSAKVIFSVTILTVGLLLGPLGFYAGGLAILQILGLSADWLWLCCLAMGGVIAAYSIAGGLASEMIMDVAQGLILLIGGGIVLVAGLLRVAGDQSMHFEPRQLELILPAGDPLMPWTGVFSGLLIASLFFATTNAGLLQRVLSARDTGHARRGMLLAAGLKLAAVFVVVFPGVIAARIFPGIYPDTAFPAMVGGLLPPGVSGLVLAALVAAIMSTAETSVNNLSSMVTLNIYPLINPRASERASLRVGRVTAGVILLFSVLAAPFVGRAGLIFPLMLQVGAYLLGPVGVCYLFGRFSRRVNLQGALAVLAAGYGAGVFMVVAPHVGWMRRLVPEFVFKTNFYHVSAALALVYTVLLFAVSFATRPPGPERIAWMDAARRAEAEDAAQKQRPWWQSFGFWCGVLLAAFVAIYVVF